MIFHCIIDIYWFPGNQIFQHWHQGKFLVLRLAILVFLQGTVCLLVSLAKEEPFKVHLIQIPGLNHLNSSPDGNSYPSMLFIYFFLILNKYLSIDFIHWLHSLHRASLLPLQHANSEYLERAIMSSLNLSFFRVNISSSFIYSFPLLHILVALPSQRHHNILNWEWLLFVYSLQWWPVTYRLLCCWTWKLNLS